MRQIFRGGRTLADASAGPVPKTCGQETTRMGSVLKCSSSCYYENSEGIMKQVLLSQRWLNAGHSSLWHRAASTGTWIVIVLRRLKAHQTSWSRLQGEPAPRAQLMMRFTLKCTYTASQFQRRGSANEIALLPASAKLCPQEGSGSFPEEHRLPGGTEMVLRLLGRVSGIH